MKLRTIAIALAFALALPLAAPTLGLGWGLGELPSAYAQDKKTELAREKFNEGVAAYDAGQFEKARTLFLQAYALKRHPLVLLNLGQSELKSGHIEDGGNHLQQFLREHENPTAQQKKDADAGIAEAQKKTGYVIFIVDQDGADLTIDGVSIGKSPLADPYFVTPGKHEATAAKGKNADSRSFEAKKGTATPVTLTLGGGAVAVPVPVPSPDPGPVVPSPDPVGLPTPVPDPMPTYTPPLPTPVPSPMGPPVTGADTGREDLVSWFTRKPGAWVLVGLAGAGLIGTVAFGIAAASADSAASDVSDQILAEVKKGESEGGRAKLPPQYWSDGDGTGEPQPCGSLDDPESGYAYYKDACNQLRDNIDAYDADINGLALAGVTVYYFVDTSGSGRATGSIALVPAISPEARGATLIGEF
jgi:hypothetical protein